MSAIVSFISAAERPVKRFLSTGDMVQAGSASGTRWGQSAAQHVHAYVYVCGCMSVP